MLHARYRGGRKNKEGDIPRDLAQMQNFKISESDIASAKAAEKNNVGLFGAKQDDNRSYQNPMAKQQWQPPKPKQQMGAMSGFGISKAEMQVIKEFQQKEQMAKDIEKFNQIEQRRKTLLKANPKPGLG